MAETTCTNNHATTNLGFEAKHRHDVLGDFFLNYISAALESRRSGLEAQKAEDADIENPDEYRAVDIFGVRKEALWSYFKTSANYAWVEQK